MFLSVTHISRKIPCFLQIFTKIENQYFTTIYFTIKIHFKKYIVYLKRKYLNIKNLLKISKQICFKFNRKITPKDRKKL